MMKRKEKVDYARWIFVLPALLVVGVLLIYPIFSSLYCTKSLARRLVLSTWFYYFFSKKSVFLKIKVAVFLYMFYC